MSKTLADARKEFRRQHPNLRVVGWDERDYKLWSALNGLPSYGLIPGKDNHLVSSKDVFRILEQEAERRFEAEWRASI